MIGGQTVSNGIYILHTNGKLYTSDKWNYSWRNDAVGAALISDNSSFVISKDEMYNQYWSERNSLISGVTTTKNIDEAKKDFKGFQNTKSIVEYTGTRDYYAARNCANYQFKNSSKGYLASAGEWIEIMSNTNEIDSCMDLIDGAYIGEGINGIESIYWTSTQYDGNNAWMITYNKTNGIRLNSERKSYHVEQTAIRPITQLI